MSADLIKILIRDCRIDLHIGLYESEMKSAQPVVINVECEARLTRRYDDIAEKEVAEVIDYPPIYHFICDELTQIGHIYFLESAAEKIADFCFSDARIDKVRVRIEKTKILAHAASGGIEIVRTRP
jgi:dihydroneopterin aldolase